MDIQVLTQPLAGSSSAAAFIASLAADEAITRIDIAVAWAKRSGLRHVRDALAAFTERGGSLRIVTGISQGGATRQGLTGIAELTNDSYVFHQPSRTFHPKLYLGTGVSVGRFLIGSQNLTQGGLISNFELGVTGTANLTMASDQKVVSDLQDYMNRLITDSAACKQLTDETLAELLRDPHYLISDEGETAPLTSGVAKPGEAWVSIFAKSNLALQSGSAPDSRKLTVLGDVAPASPKTHATVVRRWYKKLPASSVSRVGGNTNPQGHLTLTKGPRIEGHRPHPIKQGTYFRQTFFSDAAWGPGQTAASEVATVTVEVVARGVEMGIFTIAVEHNMSFDSGQGNRQTFLHWGPQLSEYLRKRVDHTGDIVTLEKLDDGTYRLTMDAKETGPFL